MLMKTKTDRNKRWTAWAAKFLVFTFLVGLLTSFHAADVQAATGASKSNKALSMKVTFNGKKSDSTDNWNANTYVLNTQYKKADKLKNGMKSSMTVYIPTATLKKDGDCVHISTFVALYETKKGEWRGDINGQYTVMLRKNGKKIELAKWNETKQKEEKIGKLATYKKSGKYYVVTINNMTYQSKMWNSKGKQVKVSSLSGKSKYYMAQCVNITGLCAKSKNVNLYVDNLTLNGNTTQKVTFDKKDYIDIWGWYCKGNGKGWKVSVSAIK